MKNDLTKKPCYRPRAAGLLCATATIALLAGCGSVPAPHASSTLQIAPSAAQGSSQFTHDAVTSARLPDIAAATPSSNADVVSSSIAASAQLDDEARAVEGATRNAGTAGAVDSAAAIIYQDTRVPSRSGGKATAAATQVAWAKPGPTVERSGTRKEAAVLATQAAAGAPGEALQLAAHMQQVGASASTEDSLTAVVPAREPAPVDRPVFSLNLGSTLRPIDSALVTPHPEFNGRRLYGMRIVKDGQIWHRLRLGFFADRGSAQQALEAVKDTYPSAWVSQASRLEVLASSDSILLEPRGLADSYTNELAVAPAPSTAGSAIGVSALNLTIPEAGTGDVASEDPDRGSSLSRVPDQVAANLPSRNPASSEPSPAADVNDVPSSFGFRDEGYRASSTELGLLQRWSQYGGGESEIDGTSYSFGGDVSQVSAEGDSSDRFGATSEAAPFHGQHGQWQEEASLTGDLEFSDVSRLKLSHSYNGELSREDEENFGLAFVGLPGEWDEDTLNDTTFQIGLLDDRLELTSLHSVSRHGDAELGRDVVMGHGFAQGLDVELIRGEGIGLSVSSSYGISDDDYGFNGDDDDDDEDDDEDDDRLGGNLKSVTEAMDYGLKANFALGFTDLSLSHEKTWETNDVEEDYEQEISSDYTLGLGFDALNLRFSFIESVETEGRGEDRSTRTSNEYAAEAEYQVHALRDLAGDALGEAFWEFAPTSITTNYGLVRSSGSFGAQDETTELGFGAYWGWDGGYAGISYSYYYMDDQQSGSGDNDYRSETYDISGGLHRGKWSFDGGLEFGQSAGLGRWNESTEFEVDPYLSITYEPDDLPNISLYGSTSYYEGNYVADGGTSMSRYWDITTELDFAKFWPDILNSKGEGMKAVFQLEGNSSREDWGSDVSQDSRIDYFVGFKVDLNLGE